MFKYYFILGQCAEAETKNFFKSEKWVDQVAIVKSLALGFAILVSLIGLPCIMPIIVELSSDMLYRFSIA
eukprot:snap_masked-scaffold_12-processed-gene-9.7-mRNA-1 protein AED:1.00 eAED:1.00 QI:0/-1/0/0/-1/1/1/0/69